MKKIKRTPEKIYNLWVDKIHIKNIVDKFTKVLKCKPSEVLKLIKEVQEELKKEGAPLEEYIDYLEIVLSYRKLENRL